MCPPQRARDIPSYNHRSAATHFHSHSSPSNEGPPCHTSHCHSSPLSLYLSARSHSLFISCRVCCVSAVVVSRARDDFHRNRSLTGPQQAEAVTIGYTQLDNLTAQVAHMRQMLATDMLVHRGGMVEWRRDEEAQRRREEMERKEQAERKRLLQEIRRQQRKAATQQQQSANDGQSQPAPQQQQHEPSS